MDKFLAHEIENLQRLKNITFFSYLTDVNGVVLAASDASAQLSGRQTGEELKGLCAATITDEQIHSLIPDLTAAELIAVKQNFATLAKIMKIVVLEQVMINYIDFNPYGGIRAAYLQAAIPIFGEDLTVVGIRVVSSVRPISLFGKNEYFNHLSQNSNVIQGNDKEHIKPKTNPRFTTRQLEIIYLLSNGFSQMEAAQILHISRGALSNILSYQIYHKFGIEGANHGLFMEYAKSAGLQQTMPRSLYKPFIIILDDELVARYFNNDLNNEQS